MKRMSNFLIEVRKSISSFFQIQYQEKRRFFMDKEIIFEKTDKPIKGGVLLPHIIHYG